MSALRACVVVPARDEEALIGACLDALALQTGVDRETWEVIVVLDACTDATATEVARAQRRRPGLRVRVVQGPGRGAGPARRVGMDLAAARLDGDGLIACTDADSLVAPDWLATQLAAVARGVSAIGGRIEIDPGELALLPPAVARDRVRRQRDRHRLILQDPGPPGSISQHWQFSGASMAVTAEVYGRVGGMNSEHALEDEAFERALVEHGIPIHRLLAVRVTTSGRLVGRASRGLAHDLAAAAAGGPPLARLAKGTPGIPGANRQEGAVAKRDKDLFDKLRDSGLRKRTAKRIADAAGGGGTQGKKALKNAVSDLRGLASDLEDRAKGGPAKRKATAKKAAATRKRNARKRSQAAKKAAKTRAKA